MTQRFICVLYTQGAGRFGIGRIAGRCDDARVVSSVGEWRLAPKQALYINGLQYIASDHIYEYETYLLLPGLSRPVLRFRFVSPHASLPFLCSAASRDRGIRTPTSVTGLSAQPALVQPLDQS